MPIRPRGGGFGYAPRVIRRAFAWIAALRYWRDSVALHRRRGVKIGERVDLIGGGPRMFGSEPYLLAIGDDVTISHDDPSGATPIV
jgi:hypothetical protein